MNTYNAIYNTEAGIITTNEGFRFVQITRISGLERYNPAITLLPLNGYPRLELRLWACDTSNFIKIDPAVKWFEDVIMVFEKLDGVELRLPWVRERDYGTITDSQLEFMCENKLDHVAIMNKQDNTITRYRFPTTATLIHDTEADGQELFRIMANRIAAQKGILMIQSGRENYEDVVQYSPVL